MKAANTRLSGDKFVEFLVILESDDIKRENERLRNIPENRKVRLRCYDIKLDLVMPELIENRRQLLAIGVDINPVNRFFMFWSGWDPC